MSPTPPQVNTALIKQRLTKGDVKALFARNYPRGGQGLAANVGAFWTSLVEVWSQLELFGECSVCHIPVGTCECIKLWHKWAAEQTIPTTTLYANRQRLEEFAANSKRFSNSLQMLFRELHWLGCEPTSV